MSKADLFMLLTVAVLLCACGGEHSGRSTDGDSLIEEGEASETDDVAPDGDGDKIPVDSEADPEADSEADPEADSETEVSEWSDFDGMTSATCETIQCFPVVPTRQTICYDLRYPLESCPGTAGSADCATTPFCGQDSQYPHPERTFTVEGEAEEAVVRDSRTGLVWQQPCSNEMMFRWEGLQYCADLVYAGAEDWRLPNLHELWSLMNLGLTIPEIDTTLFPMSDNYRLQFISSVFFEGWAFIMNLEDGMINVDEEDKMMGGVRCVRGGVTIPPQPRYEMEEGPRGEGVIWDAVTGLGWQRGVALEKTWEEGLAYCEGLDFAGYDDWRLPTITELISLANFSFSTSSTDLPVFTEETEILFSSTPDPFSFTTSFWDAKTLEITAVQLKRE